MHTATHSTYQLSEIVLKLRDDLNVSVRAERGGTTWLIEDDRTGRYYRVGHREYTFLSLLDGRRTFDSALGRTAALLKDHALTSEEAGALCRWLVETGLATTNQSTSTARVLNQIEKVQRHKLLRGLLSPLSQTVPLLRPDRWFRTLASLFGWLCSGPMLIVYLVLAMAGGFAVAEDWDRFRQQTPYIIAREHWLWLAMIWGILKLVHEAAHGFVCRLFGGHVREAGVTLVLFVPLPYVDVTSAWRFGSKWQRIATSAAGMGAEMVVGALAAILWSRTEPGWINEQAHAVVLSATVVTLLFNANPLMRFDGYYILSDLLGLPNLATHGAQAWRQLGRRWCLGLPGEVPQWPEGRTWLILTYGLAALLWRIAVCVGLIVAADALFFGAGIVLAGLALVLWLMVPAVRLLWFVLRGSSTERPSRFRFVTAMTALVGVLWLVGQKVTWSDRPDAPAVVAYRPVTEIRPAVAGFVEQLSVTDGEFVEAGRELLRLRNMDLETDLNDLVLQIQQSRLRADMQLRSGELSTWEAEQERIAGLQERELQLERRLAALIVRSPRDGVVLEADISSLLGRYVATGEPVLRLGVDDDLRLLALIDPADRGRFVEDNHNSIDVLIDGRPDDPISGRICSLASRAGHTLPHPALGAHVDGALEVRPATTGDEDGASEASMELASPHLLLELELTIPGRSDVRAGETGRVRLPNEEQPIASWLSKSLSNWWTRRETALREQWYR